MCIATGGSTPAIGSDQPRSVKGLMTAFQAMRGDPGAKERFQAMHGGMTVGQIVQQHRQQTTGY